MLPSKAPLILSHPATEERPFPSRFFYRNQDVSENKKAINKRIPVARSVAKDFKAKRIHSILSIRHERKEKGLERRAAKNIERKGRTILRTPFN